MGDIGHEHFAVILEGQIRGSRTVAMQARAFVGLADWTTGGHRTRRRAASGDPLGLIERHDWVRKCDGTAIAVQIDPLETRVVISGHGVFWITEAVEV
jgi:hypothetical protein